MAYVGITRAKRLSKISFAQNRRTRGLYQSAVPSRFVDDLPEDHVEVLEAKSPFGGAYQNFANPFDRMNPYGKSRFDEAPPSRFKAAYETPGWQRAKANEQKSFGDNWSRDADRKRNAALRPPITIEGQIIASSTASSGYAVGNRVRHQKFGPGTVTEVDGNKLTIRFDHSGTKRVVDSFVVRA